MKTILRLFAILTIIAVLCVPVLAETSADTSDTTQTDATATIAGIDQATALVIGFAVFGVISIAAAILLVRGKKH